MEINIRKMIFKLTPGTRKSFFFNNYSPSKEGSILMMTKSILQSVWLYNLIRFLQYRFLFGEMKYQSCRRFL